MAPEPACEFPVEVRLVVDDEPTSNLNDKNYRKRFVIGCSLGRVANHTVHLSGRGPMTDCTLSGHPSRYAEYMPPVCT